MLEDSELFTSLAKPRIYFGLPVKYGIFCLTVTGLLFIFADSVFVKFVLAPSLLVALAAFGKFKTIQDDMWFDVIVLRLFSLKETIFGGRYNA